MSQPLTPATATKHIAGHLQRITHQNFWRSFEDWLALAVHAFQRDDDAYMKIMARYGPREAPMGEKDHAADHFARALGAWMHAMQQQSRDYLGQVYEEQGAANHYAGQFLTPEPVVELMASMTMPEPLSDDALVADPACGSGRMLIAGIKRNRFATFVGTDVDLSCVHMAALNCLVRNANSYVVHGNSLSLEAWGGYAVRRSFAGATLHRLTPEQAAHIIALPFQKRAEASAALTPVERSQPEPKLAISPEAPKPTFTVTKKGQMDFGF